MQNSSVVSRRCTSRAKTNPSANLPPYVREALRGLTTAQKRVIKDGSFHGDVSMETVSALVGRAIFYLHPTSPNGRCGDMRLTPLGERVREILKASEVAPEGASQTPSQSDGDGRQQGAQAPSRPTEPNKDSPHGQG